MTGGLSGNLRRKVDTDILNLSKESNSFVVVGRMFHSCAAGCSFDMKRLVVASLSFTRSRCLQGGNSSLKSKPSAFDKLHVKVIGNISCDCLPGVYNYVPFSSALE